MDDSRCDAGAAINAGGSGVAGSGGAARRADPRDRRAPPRGMPRGHADRGRQARARSAGARAGHRRLLRRAHEDDGRGEREPRLRRLADRRRAVSAATCGWPTSKDRLFTPRKDDWDPRRRDRQAIPVREPRRSPVRIQARVERDHRVRRATMRDCPNRFATFTCEMDSATLIAAPLVLGGRNLGWMTVSSPARQSPRASGGASR